MPSSPPLLKCSAFKSSLCFFLLNSVILPFVVQSSYSSCLRMSHSQGFFILFYFFLYKCFIKGFVRRFQGKSCVPDDYISVWYTSTTNREALLVSFSKGMTLKNVPAFDGPHAQTSPLHQVGDSFLSVFSKRWARDPGCISSMNRGGGADTTGCNHKSLDWFN